LEVTGTGPLKADDVVELCSGLGFVEGPIADEAGDVILTSVSRGAVFRVPAAGGEPEQLVEVGGTPTGLARDEAGTLWIMQPGPSALKTSSELPVPVPCLQTWSASAGLAATVSDGIGAPNDAILGPDGRVWFSDMVNTDERHTTVPGRISAVDTATGAVEVLTEDVIFPNGVAFGPAGDVVYVSSTSAAQVLRYRWDGSTLSDRQVFASVPETEHPDGLAMDVEGNLYVATAWGDTIRIFSPEGTEIGMVPLPKAMPASVCFAGPERSTLMVAAARGGRVLAIPSSVPGVA
jgi:gluconolactonase